MEVEEIEEFETRRDFNKTFISGVYYCSRCNHITKSPYLCEFCGEQAAGLLKKNTYKYKIEDEGNQINEIFKPIERVMNNGNQ